MEGRSVQVSEIKEKETVEVVTAFVVYQTQDGSWMATNDFSKTMKMSRMASPDEMYGACAIVRKDIAVQETAAHVLMGLQQQARKAMEDMQNQQVMSQLGGGLNGQPGPNGLIVP